ncbi:zinc ion binding [Cladophialophora chaetospira]|uniref:Zinc ion binding n=1 Tax=Cladophialophora chaetospira TaxID=386627 RepID=A0AA38X739_9EURO|nr:zinc ion binding [Cladophialophora chaetospira]
MAATMRAWTFTSRGTPSSVLKLRNDLPKPSPAMLGPHDVLVKVAYVAVFQGSAAIMNIIPHFNSNLWIPESNFSGLIEAIGRDVQHLKVGDAVFGSPNPKHYTKRETKYNGMMAEFAIIHAGQVVRKPDNIAFDAAAGLAAEGCTILQFCQKTKIKEGDRVLICGASGGLGSVAVQIAKSIVGEEGAVVGICSAANADLVKGLGADEVVDYKSHSRLSDHLAELYSAKPFNVIMDCAGVDDSLYFESPRYLSPDGVFLAGGRMGVTHGGGGILDILSFLVVLQLRMHWPSVLGGTPRTLMFHSGEVIPESMQELPRLVEKGQLRGVIDGEWPMEDAIKAYQRVATGRARGKVVVRVQDV